MASGPSRPARTKGWHGYPWSFREQGASGAIRLRWTERISSKWVLSPLPPLPCDAALSTECTVCCSLYFSFLWNHFFLWLGNSRDYWTNRSGWRERRAGNWFWHALQAWRHWILEYWKGVFYNIYREQLVLLVILVIQVWMGSRSVKYWWHFTD